MGTIELKSINDISIGDTLIIERKSDNQIITCKAELIVDSGHGIEVITDIEKNTYFNTDMYKQGKSWAKEVKIIKNSVPENSKTHC